MEHRILSRQAWWPKAQLIQLFGVLPARPVGRLIDARFRRMILRPWRLNQSDAGGERQMEPSTSLYAALAGYVGRPDQTGRVGVFRRDAVGGEWQQVLPDLEAFTVVVHPRQPALVLAGTEDGVWRSEDHGATFTRADF